MKKGMKRRILALVTVLAMLAICACGAPAAPAAATTAAGTTAATTAAGEAVTTEAATEAADTTAAADTAADTTTAAAEGEPDNAAAAAAVAATAPIPTGAAGDETNPFMKYDPPIELPVAFNTSAVQYFPEGDDYENNVWSRYLLEYAGIKIKPLWTADGSTDAYRTKMNVSLASGDLPAIFDGDYQFFRQAVDAGYAADLTSIWPDYRSDDLIKASDGFDVAFNSATVDGKLLAIPQLAYLEQQGMLLWIRSDWLEAVGMEAPKTMDEMVAVARAFKENDPDGNGQADTFGLGLRKDIFTFDFFNINGIMSGFGVPTRANEQFFRDASGSIAYAGIMPEAKEALTLVNQMYNEGIIDPEFGVIDAPRAEEDINTHKVGMGYGAEWNGWWPYATVYAADKVIYKAYAPPAAEGKELAIGTPFPVTNYTMVNSSYEHPEAAIVLRNWASALTSENSSDAITEYYSAKEQWRFVPWKFGAPSEMQMYPYLKEAFANGNDESVVPNTYRRFFKEVLSFIENGDPLGQGRWSQVGPDGSSIGIIVEELMPADVYTVSPILGERPESFLNLMTSLNKIIEQSYTEIIVGPPGDVSAKFDEFVSNWLAAGGQQVTDDLNAMYPQ